MKTTPTKIEWADYTFNPWRGCTKVSEGCWNCYAEAQSKRNPAVLGEWGPGKPRVLASDDMWRSPLRWNKDAGAARHEADWGSDDQVTPPPRPRVFCASLADVFDPEVPTEWRQRLFQLIDDTPNLDWLLLTKRPEQIEPLMQNVMRGNFDRQKTFAQHLPNVWLGATAENQERAQQRIPSLVSIAASCHFLSCEPLLGPVDVLHWLPYRRLNEEYMTSAEVPGPTFQVDWIIAGGESGPGARPMHPDWARSLRDQCQAAGVPFLFKQWGAWLPQSQAKHAAALSDDRKLKGQRFDDGTLMLRMAKETAGRVLDGRTHDDFPAPAAPVRNATREAVGREAEGQVLPTYDAAESRAGAASRAGAHTGV